MVVITNEITHVKCLEQLQAQLILLILLIHKSIFSDNRQTWFYYLCLCCKLFSLFISFMSTIIKGRWFDYF